MPASRRLTRPAFDARHEFVATPPAGRTSLAVGGSVLPAGARLDKGSVDARRLRQMYDSRLIAIAPGSKLPSVERGAPKPRVVGPVDPACSDETQTTQPRGLARVRSKQR